MALELAIYPDPVLRRRAALVQKIDDELRERVREMFAILYKEKGIGLAAPQVGWGARLFIINTKGEPDPKEERVYVNPRILDAEGEVRAEEGCLSIPDIRGMVTRSRKVRLSAQDLQGKLFEEEAVDLGARAVQHELDHLDGILFISRLSATDRFLLGRSLKKLEKEYEGRVVRAR
jgi:peptide deformylase